MAKNQGTITQIVSVVVDVEFEGQLPQIYQALEVKTQDHKTIVLEVESPLLEQLT